VPSGASSLPKRPICPWILREAFNDGQYVERAARGALRLEIKRSHLVDETSHEPPGTLAQTLWYWTQQDELIAKAFRYRRDDGTLGGSGQTDPKWIKTETARLTVLHRDEALCAACPGC